MKMNYIFYIYLDMNGRIMNKETNQTCLSITRHKFTDIINFCFIHTYSSIFNIIPKLDYN